jgi:signal transduction histidine kinase
MLEKLINLGIEEGYSLSEIKRIKLLNKIVLLFSTLVLIKLGFELYALDPIGSTIVSILLLTFIFTLVFNYRKKFVFARIYFITILCLALAIINTLFGRGFGGEFGFFPVIMIILIFFDNPRIQQLIILMFLTFYGISVYFLYYNAPILIHNLSDSTFYFLFISCVGAVFLSASFFIGENKKYEVEMQKLIEKVEAKNKGLETANQELERFAYAASHDLKTPLRNVNSFLNLIQLKVKQGKINEIPEYLEFASLNAQRMYRLIEDILEFSRFSNAEFVFNYEDLNHLFSLAMTNIDAHLKSKNAVVHCETLPTIYCNSTQMISLFQNLIENGIKYNQSPTPTMNITCKENPSAYDFYFSDNGIGIDKAYQEKIFEMFYRLHHQGEYEGSGIGLSSCKKIVTYHGGDISVESHLNQGTTFKITLPKVSNQLAV